MWWIRSANLWDDISTITNMTVNENIRKDTGLITPQGKTIYKEPNEIGFGRKQNVYSVKG